MKRIVAIFLVLYSVPVWSYLFSSDYSSAIDKIVIDPGHGGKDPGSLGTGRYASNEKDIALDVALKFGKYIGESMPDVEVIYTRDSDDYPQLYERTALANREKAIYSFLFIVMIYGLSSIQFVLFYGWNESREAV